MPDDLCRRLFVRGAQRSDLCLVEGTLEQPKSRPDCAPHDRPGGLRPIVEALDLPVVALVSCQPLSEFHLPYLPPQVDAILLDGLEDPAQYEVYRSLVTLISRKPVLGAVEALPEVRAALRLTPRDRMVPEEVIGKLGASFLRFADLKAIRQLATSRPFPQFTVRPDPAPANRFRVAYAQDEAFGSYFPDTLEALESLGAELVEFSPLRDETLPDGVDLVMIGCGFPDRYADALTANLSLISSLRNHVCRGQRIYSEGGGTAYLGRFMILDGRRVPGAGILPFDAELRAFPKPPSPVTRVLSQDSWLGAKGTEVRGYKARRWRLIPGVVPMACPNCYGTLTSQCDITYHHHAIGSLIHLHLGALPQVVSAFAGPHRASLSLPSPRF